MKRFSRKELMKLVAKVEVIYVKDVMSRRVRTIDSTAEVIDPARRMSQRKIGPLAA